MFRVIETTTNKKKIAKSISDELISNKLVACVQIIDNTQSQYVWKNKTCTENEIIVRSKTIIDKLEDVCSVIKKHHNYENPEIVSFNMDIHSEKYKNWLLKSLEN